jgi:hypothetical protein
MSYADEIKKMTSDPGARRLGAIADDLAAKIAVLEKKVADCCGSEGTSLRASQPPVSDAPATDKPNPA